jgi:hypothetical protein
MSNFWVLAIYEHILFCLKIIDYIVCI